MHLLAINQFFWPDSAATGHLLTDVVRAVDPNLNTVTVLCGQPDYGALESGPAPPVKIFRSRGVRFSRSKLGRLASYGSFFASATLRSILVPKPDLVLTLTTPPLIFVLGTVLKSLRGSQHFIWEMDLYPEIAVNLNVLRRSFLTRLIGTLGNFSRKRADGIIALGEDMKIRLVASGIPEHKIFVVENWADGYEIVPSPFSDGPLVTHYSGTFGLAHEHYTITEAMRQLRGDSRFRFVFAGGGARRERLEQFCYSEKIDTAEFRPYARRCDLSRGLADGHVGLVTQLPETIGALVPSKTYGIMAAGRPILYVGPKEATPAHVITDHRCGWQIEPRDVAGLVRLLRNLESDRSLVRDAGARARSAFEKFYDKHIGVDRILGIIGISKISNSSNQARRGPDI